MPFNTLLFEHLNIDLKPHQQKHRAPRFEWHALAIFFRRSKTIRFACPPFRVLHHEGTREWIDQTKHRQTRPGFGDVAGGDGSVQQRCNDFGDSSSSRVLLNLHVCSSLGQQPLVPSSGGRTLS